MKRLTNVALIFFLATYTSWAIPAKRTPYTFRQADGSCITIVKQGDEYFHYYATTDGIMVTEGADGSFYYARLLENGMIGASDILAHDLDKRPATDLEFIRQNEETVRELAAQRRAQRQRRASTQQAESEVPQTGTPRIPVILIQYADVQFSEGENAHEEYEKRISTEGYNEGRDHGSVRDYFLAQSDGKFDPQFDIIGPVTLSENRSYYGANGLDGNDMRAGEMIEEACIKAREEGLITDFSVYDNNGDGFVDVVYTIYAGVGEASSTVKESIWPHQWLLKEALGRTLSYDNVEINKYACNNELYGTFIDGMGTFCHEFSHCLGLPDFYPTNSSGYFGMGRWDLMDYGSYNDGSHTPCGYSAYEKEFMGWKDIATLNGEVTDIRMEALNTEAGTAYKIYNDVTPDEYFILENRQQTGWDTFLPGHGMLVTHIDYDLAKWYLNTVNNNEQQGVTLVPADGLLTADEIGLQGDPYPGIKEVTSIPELEVYTGGTIKTSISNITEVEGVISFDFKEIPFVAPVPLPATNVTESSFTANWEAVEYAETYSLKVQRLEENAGKTEEKLVRLITVTAPNTSYEVKDLETNSIYTYCIRSCQKYRETDFSDPITVTLTDNSSGMADIATAGPLVSVSGSSIIFSTSEKTVARIYSADGRLQKEVIVLPGISQTDMPDGIYLLRIGDTSAKVIVPAR